MTEYITEWYWDETRNAPNQAQREKIVRCRDCKWMSKDTVHYKACYRLHAIEFMVEPDGFCAWGERQDA